MQVPEAVKGLLGRKRYTPPPYHSFALYGGHLYFPTIGVTPNGLYREVDPVLVIPLTREVLADALARALSRKPERVNEYPRRGAMKSPVQLAARCRSWISFARASLRYGLVQSDAAWLISVSASPTPDDTESRDLPRDSSPRALAAVAMEFADRYPLWRIAPRKTR